MDDLIKTYASAMLIPPEGRSRPMFQSEDIPSKLRDSSAVGFYDGCYTCDESSRHMIWRVYGHENVVVCGHCDTIMAMRVNHILGRKILSASAPATSHALIAANATRRPISLRTLQIRGPREGITNISCDICALISPWALEWIAESVSCVACVSCSAKGIWDIICVPRALLMEHLPADVVDIIMRLLYALAHEK